MVTKIDEEPWNPKQRKTKTPKLQKTGHSHQSKQNTKRANTVLCCTVLHCTVLARMIIFYLYDIMFSFYSVFSFFLFSMSKEGDPLSRRAFLSYHYRLWSYFEDSSQYWLSPRASWLSLRVASPARLCREPDSGDCWFHGGWGGSTYVFAFEGWEDRKENNISIVFLFFPNTYRHIA